MRLLIIPLLLLVNSYAITPFSLEEFKEANVKILSKSSIIKKSFKQKLLKDLKTELKALNINTKSEHFSNLLIKIETVSLKQNIVVNVTLAIVEDVAPLRNKELTNMAITYRKNDMFDTTKENLETDIYESAIEYLLYDFIEQYQEENS